MNHPIHYILLLSIVGLLLISCEPNVQQNVSEYESRIDSIFSDYNDSSKPGAAVAVVKDGSIVFKKGYGSANLEYDIPVTPSTIFHIASVSKQFTVFSILLLADEGKLNFDDDIRKYIPEVPDFGKTITLRHLASHTSGLRDQWNLLAMAGWRLDDVITKEHVLKLVANQKELNFEPGEAYTYCNTGFTLLAEVVSRVSGESFAEFTNARIFNPLRMSNTLFYDDHERIVTNRAYSYYTPDHAHYKKSVLSYANVGATSLFTTVEDLSLWAMNFESPKVGNTEILDQMNTLAKLNNGETFGGAYGQFIDTHNGLHQIQHGGADAGYRTYLGRFPDQKFAVVVFSNFADANPTGLALQVADLYLKDQMTVETYEQPEETAFITVPSDELEEFAGDYWNDMESYSRKIYVKNDTLRYSRGGNNESVLMPTNKNTFQMLDVPSDLNVRFENENGQKRMIVSMNNENPSTFEGYIPPNYSQQELQQFTGTFYSEELSTTYTLMVKDNKLVATHPRNSDITITPVKQDLFSGNKWFFSSILFERNQSASITGIRVSSGRVMGLYFKKQ